MCVNITLRQKCPLFAVLLQVAFVVLMLGCKQSTPPPPPEEKEVDVIITPSPAYFGRIPINSQAKRIFEIFNNGEVKIQITSIQVEGRDANQFSVETNSVQFPVNLEPVSFMDLNVYFHPTTAGDKQALVKINTSKGVFTDTLTGKGTSAVDAIVPFERIIGTPQNDGGTQVVGAQDGGYIIVGSSVPSADVDYPDAFIVKTNSQGEVQWEKHYGGNEEDWANDVQPTTDGGYLVLGVTRSFGAGGLDAFLVKIDAQGNELWFKTYGEKFDDELLRIIPLEKGGYLLVGATLQSQGQNKDAWLVRIDDNGNVQWQKTYGTSDGGDQFSSALEMLDGSIFIVGSTTSMGQGGFDIYLLKLDANGNQLWAKTFGGSEWEKASDVKLSDDGNLLICGYTASKGAGAKDAYLLKVSLSGQLIWDKVYGTTHSETLSSILVDPSGNIYLAGSTVNRITSQKQFTDGYLIKTDANGQLLWENQLGGAENESFASLAFALDGGIVSCGITESFGKSSDIYFVKFSTQGSLAAFHLLSKQILATNQKFMNVQDNLHFIFHPKLAELFSNSVLGYIYLI